MPVVVLELPIYNRWYAVKDVHNLHSIYYNKKQMENFPLLYHLWIVFDIIFPPKNIKKLAKTWPQIILAIINKLLLNINNLNSQFSKASTQILTQFYL